MIRSLIGSLALFICAVSAAEQSVYGAENCPQPKAILQRDWPGLERYRIANTKTAPPLREERRVVFFGDSITELWNLREYFGGMPYINRGISGQTSSQMLIRFRPDVIALRPGIVVILAGTNDIAGKHDAATMNVVRDNLSSMGGTGAGS
jgi:lysophospholipase L1-like esterase